MRLISLLIFGFTAIALGNLSKKPVRLLDLFSVEKNPGKGFITYTQNGKAEKISFGETDAHYALGLVFDGATLPDPTDPELKKSQIIQLALGNLKRVGPDPIPQFGAATFLAARIPVRKTEFRLAVPTGKNDHLLNTALLMFTSPSNPGNQNDEDKLTGTYFANSGKGILSPLDKPELVEVKSHGNKLTFYRQVMTLELDGTMVSPFNPAENSLKGNIEIPVFWPQGKEARDLTNRLAKESLSGPHPLPSSQSGITQHNREVSGSLRKKKP